jgi:hypothetical protein
MSTTLGQESHTQGIHAGHSPILNDATLPAIDPPVVKEAVNKQPRITQLFNRSLQNAQLAELKIRQFTRSEPSKGQLFSSEGSDLEILKGTKLHNLKRSLKFLDLLEIDGNKKAETARFIENVIAEKASLLTQKRLFGIKSVLALGVMLVVGAIGVGYTKFFNEPNKVTPQKRQDHKKAASLKPARDEIENNSPVNLKESSNETIRNGSLNEEVKLVPNIREAKDIKPVSSQSPIVSRIFKDPETGLIAPPPRPYNRNIKPDAATKIQQEIFAKATPAEIREAMIKIQGDRVRIENKVLMISKISDEQLKTVFIDGKVGDVTKLLMPKISSTV